MAADRSEMGRLARFTRYIFISTPPFCGKYTTDGEDRQQKPEKQGERMKTITDEPIISTWQARSLLALMDAFYSNPENAKAFEKWKKEREEAAKVGEG